MFAKAMGRSGEVLTVTMTIDDEVRGHTVTGGVDPSCAVLGQLHIAGQD
jgi:hypothetical protein